LIAWSNSIGAFFCCAGGGPDGIVAAPPMSPIPNGGIPASGAGIFGICIDAAGFGAGTYACGCWTPGGGHLSCTRGFVSSPENSIL